VSHDDECIHLLPPGQCSYCKPKPEEFRMFNEDLSGMIPVLRVFPAKYDGYCPECKLPIYVGQMIAWRPDHAPAHEDCA